MKKLIIVFFLIVCTLNLDLYTTAETYLPGVANEYMQQIGVEVVSGEQIRLIFEFNGVPEERVGFPIAGTVPPFTFLNNTTITGGWRPAVSVRSITINNQIPQGGWKTRLLSYDDGKTRWEVSPVDEAVRWGFQTRLSVTWHDGGRPGFTGIQMLAGSRPHVVIDMNSEVTWVADFINLSTMMRYEVRAGGVEVENHMAPRNQVTVRTFVSALEPVPPVVIRADDVWSLLGDPVDWTQGVEAHWGLTVTNLIPGMGEITNVTMDSATADMALTDEGITYDKIGSSKHWLEIRDAHSLSSDYPDDSTVTTVQRKHSVYTDEAPELLLIYAPNSVDINGIRIPANTTHDYTAQVNDAGGEDGWTNQKLNISLKSGHFNGTFDTILRFPNEEKITDQYQNEILYEYREQFANADTQIEGFLSERNEAGNVLSAVATALMKIDLNPPTAGAEYLGGYSFKDISTDELSGISKVSSPTEIAFAEPNATTAPTDGWAPLEEHGMDTPGNYSVWVRAMDKAGNRDTKIVSASLYIGGEVSISKDTDQGAFLHMADCTHADKMTRVACDSDSECSPGEMPELEEKSEFQYELKLTNTAKRGNAEGTFKDYLPVGVVPIRAPSAIAGEGVQVEIENSTLILDDGPNDGRYLIEGSYSNLEPEETITVTIPVKAPAYDNTPDADNVLSNQASTSWTIGSESVQMKGTNLSNYANHEVIVVGVETVFTKVGADDLTSGQAGAEFMLYKWNNVEQEPTEEEKKQIINSDLVDNGSWRRVKFGGEEATLEEGVFVSSESGEVDLGKLPKGIYTLIETKAPVGYELPVGQWILVVDPKKRDTGTGDYQLEFVGKSNFLMPPAAIREITDGEISYKIINAKPFSIGRSGLGGTRRMLLLGLTIMAFAGTAYCVFSYKQKKANQ